MAAHIIAVTGEEAENVCESAALGVEAAGDAFETDGFEVERLVGFEIDGGRVVRDPLDDISARRICIGESAIDVGGIQPGEFGDTLTCDGGILFGLCGGILGEWVEKNTPTDFVDGERVAVAVENQTAGTVFGLMVAGIISGGEFAQVEGQQGGDEGEKAESEKKDGKEKAAISGGAEEILDREKKSWKTIDA